MEVAMTPAERNARLAVRATGDDDPALVETSWPMPSPDLLESLWRLRNGRLTRTDRLRLSVIVNAYVALIGAGTTADQVRRLAALRRVHRKRSR
jgi:hypothetical protein